MRKILTAALLAVFSGGASAEVYEVNLSDFELDLSRFSNGYVQQASPGSITIIGSNGTYYPNTSTTVSFVNPLRQLVEDEVASGNLNNDAPVFTRFLSLEELDQSAYRRISPTSFYQYLPSDWSREFVGATFSMVVDIVTISFNYSYSLNDDVGYETASYNSGRLTAGENVERKGSGLIHGLFGDPLASISENFVFELLSVDNVNGASSLTISDLQVTYEYDQEITIATAVPESAEWVFMALGFPLAIAAALRRRSAST